MDNCHCALHNLSNTVWHPISLDCDNQSRLQRVAAGQYTLDNGRRVPQPQQQLSYAHRNHNQMYITQRHQVITDHVGGLTEPLASAAVSRRYKSHITKPVCHREYSGYAIVHVVPTVTIVHRHTPSFSTLIKMRRRTPNTSRYTLQTGLMFPLRQVTAVLYSGNIDVAQPVPCSS